MIGEAVGWCVPFVLVFVLFVWSNPDARRKRALYREARRRRRALESIR